MHLRMYCFYLLFSSAFWYFQCFPCITSNIIISTPSCVTPHFFQEYFDNIFQQHHQLYHPIIPSDLHPPSITVAITNPLKTSILIHRLSDVIWPF